MPLRTDNTLISNFSPLTQTGLLPSPATPDLTPPHGQVQDIYTHGLTTTTPLRDIAIPPPFVQKTPMGPVAYNPQLPVFIQGMYPPITPQHQQVQTASMADITSSPISHPRFPTPPLSNHGELLRSPTFPQGRSGSPHDLSSSPDRHTSPDSDSPGTTSSYGRGSPERRAIPKFDTPLFSPQFPPQSFAAHLQPRRRGHARGYSTASIMTTATFATDASSPASSGEDEPAYIHDGPVKSRGTRHSNIPDATMQSYIAGPDGPDHKFVCLYPDCGKRFGRKYNIQSHIQTHLSDRPYRCEICQAGFVRQHDLRRHEKIHGGDKPFVCACRKSFARQDALTRHRQRYVLCCENLLICLGGYVLEHSQMRGRRERFKIR
jgi:Zinc finger, C2H2 type